MTAPLTRSHRGADDHYDRDAAGARRALAAALAELPGHAVACAADPAKWYDPQRVAAAVAGCSGCPLTVECDAAGAFERWGIWAGVNRDRGARVRSYGATGIRAKPATHRPRRRKRYGTPMPVPCNYCGARANAVCRTADGREAEDAHECRKRAVA